jgi:hypothetical protein
VNARHEKRIKRNVGNKVGYHWRNFLVPFPRFDNLKV